MKALGLAACLALTAMLMLLPASDAGAVTRKCGEVHKSDGWGDSAFFAIRATHMTCARAKRTIRRWPGLGVKSTPGWSCTYTSPISTGSEGYRCRRGRASFRFDFDAGVG